MQIYYKQTLPLGEKQSAIRIKRLNSVSLWLKISAAAFFVLAFSVSYYFLTGAALCLICGIYARQRALSKIYVYEYTVTDDCLIADGFDGFGTKKKSVKIYYSDITRFSAETEFPRAESSLVYTDRNNNNFIIETNGFSLTFSPDDYVRAVIKNFVTGRENGLS